THTYLLENKGDADLLILHLQPKCGCTIPHIYQGNPRVEVPVDKTALTGSKPIAVVKPGESLDLKGVNAAPPLSATFARITTEDPAAPPCWSVDVTLTGPEKTGILALPLFLETDHKKLTRIALRIIANVRTTVSFACDDPTKIERVNFGRLPRERPGPVTRSIEIVNGDPAVPYRVTAVEVESTYKSAFATEIVEV
ncbi:MAG: hypothetical protein HY812_20460, partial [Planctomycetes bacterium]|nr:hypothetical protein [Planctomycetota bacterium]